MEVLQYCPVPTSTFRATVCYGLDIRGESGGTPCRHLKPSTGREHTVINYSSYYKLLNKLLLDEGNLPPGHDVLLFSTSGTDGSFLYAQSHRHGWT